MKNKLLAAFCGLFLCSHSLLASTLDELLTIASAYTELGVDNNYVDSEIITSLAFNAYKAHAIELTIADSEPELMKAIGECVFMKEGAYSAYGNHFSDELSATLIDRYQRFIYVRQSEDASITAYRIEAEHINIGSGIFNAPCALAIQQGDSVLLMQAAAMD